MSLIDCPNCGKKVSDKAESCPNCGVESKAITETEVIPEKIMCEECGEEIPIGSAVCTNCGCPTSNKTQSTEVEINEETDSTVTPKPNKKKMYIGIGAVLCVLIILFVGMSSAKNKEQARIEEYKVTLAEASSTMLEGAIKAEDMAGDILSVWRSAINAYNKKFDYVDTQLNDLTQSESFLEARIELEVNQDEVKEMMKVLANPPEGFEESYEAIKDYYDTYLEFTELAKHATGSYNSYSEIYNELDSEIVKKYKAMDLYID